MKVLVFGSRGMLGSVVTRYLTERGHVVTEAPRYDGTLSLDDAEAVVNCAGVLKGTDGLLLANAVLPLHLAALLDGRLLVHPSTDCVFDGRRGWYRVDEPLNATDDYGMSKRIGESCAVFPNVVVLRTSIVGERGLLGWFLQQDGPVYGWTDYIWNGITTLAWAALAADAIEGRIPPGIHQPTTEPVSKFDLLATFGEVFDHRVELRPMSVEHCDRSLEPTLPMPVLRDQLTALRAWT